MPREAPSREGIVADGEIQTPVADQQQPEAPEPPARPIDGEDTAPRPPAERQAQQPPAKAEGEEGDEPPVSPGTARGDRLEEIAAARKNRDRGEYEESVAAISTGEPEPGPAPEVDPNAKVTLKVRGEILQMTAGQRDDLVREAIGDDIGDLSEKERNRYAQIYAAQKSYAQELADRRAARSAQPEPQQPQPTPEPAPKPAPKANPIVEALAAVQAGEDPEEAAAKLQSTFIEISREAAQQVREESTAEERDAFFERNLEESRTKLLEQSGEAAKNDPIVHEVVDGLYSRLERQLIVDFLDKAPDPMKAAFEQGGITTESVARKFNRDQVRTVYRDMMRQGYGLPPPSQVYQGVAAAITSRGQQPGGTTPAPVEGQHQAPNGNSPKPPAVSRTERKAGIVQPQRAAIPRSPSPAAPQPPTDAARINSSRQQLREGRQA